MVNMNLSILFGLFLQVLLANYSSSMENIQYSNGAEQSKRPKIQRKSNPEGKMVINVVSESDDEEHLAEMFQDSFPPPPAEQRNYDSPSMTPQTQTHILLSPTGQSSNPVPIAPGQSLNHSTVPSGRQRQPIQQSEKRTKRPNGHLLKAKKPENTFKGKSSKFYQIDAHHFRDLVKNLTSEKSALESSQKFRPYKPAVVKARLPPVGLKQHGGFAVEPHLLTGSWQSAIMGQQGQKVEVSSSQQTKPEMGGSSGLVEQFNEGSSGSDTSSYLNQINWDEDEMAEIPDKGSDGSAAALSNSPTEFEIRQKVQELQQELLAPPHHMYIGDDQSGHSGQFGQTIEGQHSQGHYYTDPGAAAAVALPEYQRHTIPQSESETHINPHNLQEKTALEAFAPQVYNTPAYQFRNLVQQLTGQSASGAEHGSHYGPQLERQSPTENKKQKNILIGDASTNPIDLTGTDKHGKIRKNAEHKNVTAEAARDATMQNPDAAYQELMHYLFGFWTMIGRKLNERRAMHGNGNLKLQIEALELHKEAVYKRLFKPGVNLTNEEESTIQCDPRFYRCDHCFDNLCLAYSPQCIWNGQKCENSAPSPTI